MWRTYFTTSCYFPGRVARRVEASTAGAKCDGALGAGGGWRPAGGAETQGGDEAVHRGPAGRQRRRGLAEQHDGASAAAFQGSAGPERMAGQTEPVLSQFWRLKSTAWKPSSLLRIWMKYSICRRISNRVRPLGWTSWSQSCRRWLHGQRYGRIPSQDLS